MAIIKQGILGGFSGSVAGVVGSSWKGRAVMKAKPLSVANPRTEAQVNQRTSFKLVSVFASFLLTHFVRPIYNPIAGNISGYNKFTRQNKNMFSGAGEFQPGNLYSGGGDLPYDEIKTAEYNTTIDLMTITWDSSAIAGSVRESDEVVAYAYEPTTDTYWLGASGEPRSAETLVLGKFKGGSDLMGQLQVTVGMAYVSADGRLVSVESKAQTFTIDFTV